MRILILVGLVGLSSTVFGHYAVVSQRCKSIEKSALVPSFTLTYRVGADKSYLGLERVTARKAEDHIAQGSWKGSEVRFKYEADYSRAYLFAEGGTGEFIVHLQKDDDGVGAMGFINSDGQIKVDFYRCPNFPFAD